MDGRIAGIFRYPVKGFSAEPLDGVALAPGEGFPHDRIWAVENGPSGYDPAAPAFIPKQKFTVLAALPQVAAARTRYDPDTATLTAQAPGRAAFTGRLAEAAGRQAFADWLEPLIDEDRRGPLKVLEAQGAHRFTDHPQGQVSIVNLASVRALAAAMGAEIDPLRFRANLYVDGWAAWAETEWTGRELALGEVRARVFKPIVRCAATNVNLQTARRDLDIPAALFEHYGHAHCGVYVRVAQAGRVRLGDVAAALQETP